MIGVCSSLNVAHRRAQHLAFLRKWGKKTEVYPCTTPVILGRKAQSVVCLTQEPEVPGSIPGPGHILFLFLLIQEEQLEVIGESMCTEYTLGGLRLPRNSVLRLTDHPDMTIAVVYCGHKAITQQQQQSSSKKNTILFSGVKWFKIVKLHAFIWLHL